MAYAVVQMCSGRVVAGVKVVQLHILHAAHRTNEAIRQVRGDGHHIPVVVDKEAEGTPLAQVTLSFKGIVHHFQVDLYVRHEVKNLFWGIEVGLNAVDYKTYIDIGNLLMLVVHLEDRENGCCPTELEGALHCGGHKHALCNKFLQVVKGNAWHAEGTLYGAEADVPQVETILAVKSVPWYGTLAGELQEYLVEVECGHLKEQAGNLLQEYVAQYTWVNMHKRKMTYKLTLDAVDENMWKTMCG